MQPLHDQDPTKRFTARAADYVRYRPSYPAEAVDAILAGRGGTTPSVGDVATLIVADVGAGTGISARLIVERGPSVIAIEPNAAMRDKVEPHPRLKMRDGTAEATGLDNACIDIVVCAQAFHWFRPTEALTEFHRILRASGRVALMWNVRDKADTVTTGYTDLIRAAATEHAAEMRGTAHDPLFQDGRFTNTRQFEFPNAQQLDLDGLIGRALSASYVPKSGPAHDTLMAGLRELHAAHADAAGQIALRYRCEVFLADRR